MLNHLVTRLKLALTISIPDLATGMATADVLQSVECGLMDSSVLRISRMIEGLEKKNISSPNSLPAETRESLAIRKFLRSNRKCSLHNRRFAKIIGEPLKSLTYLSQARLEIFRLLGPVIADEDLGVMVEGTTLGRGTYNTAGGVPLGPDVDVFRKLMGRSCVSATKALLESAYLPVMLAGEFQKLLKDQYITGSRQFAEVESSSLIAVPKTASIDRCIAAEPLLNVFVQQGIRAALVKRLRHWGITLDDQSRNREAARIGSISGFSEDGLATIDLESASDSIPYELVRYLLPPAWFELLDCARVPYVTYKGKSHVMHMFSSQGNSYTFALQSMIFMAIVRAVCTIHNIHGHRIVYGDDIVVPVPAYAVVVETLRYAGFKVNQLKSYCVGHFRESCGADYFDGIDVRPVYLKEDPSDRESLYMLFNLAQRKDYPFAFLDVLRQECGDDAFVGPVQLEPHGMFLEAPDFVVSKVSRPKAHRSTMKQLVWNGRSFKTVEGRIAFQVPTWKIRFAFRSPKYVTRSNFGSYLCALYGAPGRRHQLRGVSIPRTAVGSFPSYSGSGSPLWLGWYI